MKVTLYMDVESWMEGTWNFVACSRPMLPKPAGCIRYAFTVEIPDTQSADVDLGDVDAFEDESA